MKNSKPITLVASAVLALLVSSVAASAVPAVAKSAVNVRSGPGTSFAKIDVLLAGQRVNVDRCERNWCYVEKDGPDGWVSGNYLVAPSSGGSSSAADRAAAEAFAAIFGAIVGGILTPPSPPLPPAPPPPPSTPSVISAAQVDLPLNWSVNVDTGRTGSGAFAGADFSQQGTGASRVIFRQNGAQLSLGGRSQRGYSGCLAASYSNSVPVSAIMSGKTVCVKTNRGNISEFWLIGARGTTLGIKYRTWRN